MVLLAVAMSVWDLSAGSAEPTSNGLIAFLPVVAFVLPELLLSAAEDEILSAFGRLLCLG